MLNPNEIFISENSNIILVEGIDKFNFFQGIISNDIEILKKKPSIYCSLLTPQGKFQYDFFITNHGNKFYVECHKNYQKELFQKLLMYKLRSDIKITLDQNWLTVLTKKKLLDVHKPDLISFNDPRFDNFFSRSYLKSDLLKVVQEKFTVIGKDYFESLRLSLSIPDFSVDAIKEKSLLLEMRFDDLNGISWTKGCFMGQEITARMKYRNIVKKKLFKVIINYNTELNNEIFLDNKVIGQLLSHNKKEGLAFLNTEILKNQKSSNLISGDSQIKVEVPWWVKS